MRTLLLLLVLPVLLTGCPDPGCTNNITGTSNVAGCGGAGDQSGVETTTPPPVVITPVVVTPAPEEPPA